jgi:hypothetical protein
VVSSHREGRHLFLHVAPVIPSTKELPIKAPEATGSNMTKFGADLAEGTVASIAIATTSIATARIGTTAKVLVR